MKRAFPSTLLCTCIAFGLMAFTSTQTSRLRRAHHSAPSSSAAKITAVNAGANPFTIDTTMDKKKLLDRLTNKNLPGGVVVGAMDLVGLPTQSALFRNFPVINGNKISDGIILTNGWANIINDTATTIRNPAVDNY